ncbi:hypothetical protein WICPIJ_002338 [Wickerhamomyces pijperi]|uniref:Uncharacterized protein n=1 Tax=Wickerhamomyces pijperi TaxID=599730 RepID=A0A9P8QC31_WICPI|nr:hypothetical protein WICPIJ_002338 [Wickerhamomyces pijperi]
MNKSNVSSSISPDDRILYKGKDISHNIFDIIRLGSDHTKSEVVQIKEEVLQRILIKRYLEAIYEIFQLKDETVLRYYTQCMLPDADAIWLDELNVLRKRIICAVLVKNLDSESKPKGKQGAKNEMKYQLIQGLLSKVQSCSSEEQIQKAVKSLPAKFKDSEQFDVLKKLVNDNRMAFKVERFKTIVESLLSQLQEDGDFVFRRSLPLKKDTSVAQKAAKAKDQAGPSKNQIRIPETNPYQALAFEESHQTTPNISNQHQQFLFPPMERPISGRRTHNMKPGIPTEPTKAVAWSGPSVSNKTPSTTGITSTYKPIEHQELFTNQSNQAPTSKGSLVNTTGGLHTPPDSPDRDVKDIVVVKSENEKPIVDAVCVSTQEFNNAADAYFETPSANVEVQTPNAEPMIGFRGNGYTSRDLQEVYYGVLAFGLNYKEAKYLVQEYIQMFSHYQNPIDAYNLINEDFNRYLRKNITPEQLCNIKDDRIYFILFTKWYQKRALFDSSITALDWIIGRYLDGTFDWKKEKIRRSRRRNR